MQDIVYGLVFTKEGVEEHEEALAQLGLHIGLPTQRPEKTLAEGPDVFWALSATEYWVIEAKSGSRTQRIHRGDANQLAGSMNWFRTRYGSIATATPVMVHKAHKLADDASATPGMMVLDEQGLQRLKAAAISYAAGLAWIRGRTALVIGV
ncbi:MAG TPA: hypothetical protein VFD73_16580 [Gemmatimonadales bacterium]|nr:hypothetical protein [Gemmatimonadales bacterium]